VKPFDAVNERDVTDGRTDGRTELLRQTSRLYTQEVQLSHRDSAMLRVIEYFAKSLKITRGH